VTKGHFSLFPLGGATGRDRADGLPRLRRPAVGGEVGLREGRRFRNALKLSGLPHHKTLEEFDFAFQPSLDAQ
jgi:DNA replication protein DnaC